MESKAKTRYLAVLVLVVISVGIIAPNLGQVSFWDPDEARYAECARNAIKHGHWIIPYYNGHPRIVKPPLMVWLVSISSLVVGKGEVSELTSRLPSLLAGVGTVVVTFLLALSMLTSETLAFLAAFILSTTFLFYKQARFAITDMVLLSFITLACYAFYKAITKEQRVYVWLMYTALALATMDKGPAVGLVLPGLIFLVYLWSQGSLEKLKFLFYPPAILLYLVIVLPWPLLLGKKYLKKFLWENNILRFAGNPSWRTPFWFYMVNFPTHFTPWMAFLPMVAVAMKKAREDLGEIALPLAWFAVTFVIFSVSDTKRSSYILPLYPAAAIITAWAIGKGLEMKKELTGAWRLSLGFFVGVTMVYALGLVVMFCRYVPLFTPTATAALGLALIMATFIAFTAKLKNFQEGLLLAGASALVLALGYTAFYQPLFDRYYRSPKPYCLDIKARVGTCPLYHYGSIRAHDIFYTAKGVIPSLPRDGGPQGTFFVMTRAKKLESLRKLYPYLRVVKRYPFRDREIILMKGEGKKGEETLRDNSHL
ncbi:MAG: hypothetical protein DRI92_02495 [Aquificota bacterium]|nr:MAG: hypothetical protein DRI92_02495 [Aquificota bacterium]